MIVAGGLMLHSLISREDFDVYVAHDRDPIFVKLSGGKFRNGYTLKITNRTHLEKKYTVRVAGLSNVDMELKIPESEDDTILVKPDSIGEYRFFVSTPKLPDEKTKINVIVTETSNGKMDSYQTFLMTP
jgi:polyferredoxin